jgi:hypothetical protein
VGGEQPGDADTDAADVADDPHLRALIGREHLPQSAALADVGAHPSEIRRGHQLAQPLEALLGGRRLLE